MEKTYIKVGDTYYAVADDRWMREPAAFIADYPAPVNVPAGIVEEVPNPDDMVKEGAFEVSLYGWRNDELYALVKPERVGARAIYGQYGRDFGAHDAGTGFGFSEAYAAKGLQEMLERVDEVYDSVYDRTVASLRRVMEGKGPVSWNAYDNYGLWMIFEKLYGDRFGNSAHYDDGEVWVEDTPVDALTFWDGHNFRSLIVEGLGGEHEQIGLNANIELASPEEHIWAESAAAICQTRAGQRRTGIIVYTSDGNMNALPKKVYSHWQGTGWFYHWLEWFDSNEGDE